MYINKLNQCFAKKKDNVLTYTVEQHCILTGIISKSLNSIFNYKFKNEAFVIIAAHDIGKIFPIFQFKMYDGISGFDGKINNISKLNKTTLTSADKELNYHSGISSFFFKHNKNICNIISRHHGYTTNLPNKFKVKENDDETFKNLRQEFYEKILVYFNTSDKEVNSYINSLSKMQIELLSNLLVISDWLASSTFIEYSSKIYNGDINEILIKELENIGFYKNLLLKDNLSFNDIFGFMPYASQEKIIKNISGPGVYLIEEEPGRGKTESAFYAAYNMLNKNKMRGISFFLPTKLTSNKIYERLNVFLNKILEKPIDANLIYGGSKNYLHMLDQIYENTKCNKEENEYELFENKHLLFQYPFTVGTIDQGLFSILNMKFNWLKLASFYNKVIIIDEIHSYDEYTSELIKYLIDYCKELNCVVILLSATIPNKLKEKFFGKYVFINEYPLLTSYLNKLDEISLCDTDEITNKEIQIRLSNNEDDEIDRIIELASKGAQIGWIENSVVKAQKIYKKILSRIAENNINNIEVGLVHSRFTQYDRNKNEEKWTNILGKNKNNRHNIGRILIGTQILEQSIDIDFDKLITRLTTIDMLVQRIGRLHRHNNDRIAECQIPECVILTPNIEEINCLTNGMNWFVDQDMTEYSGIIYPRHLLYSTLKYLSNKTKLLLPKNIREAINFVYNYKDNSQIFAKLMALYSNENNTKLNYATANHYELNNTKRTGVSCETRLIESDDINVLLIKHINGNEITFIDGKTKINLYSDSKSLIKYYFSIFTIGISKKKINEFFKNYCLPSNLKYYYKNIDMVCKVKNEELIALTDTNEYSINAIYSKDIGFLRK